MKLNTEEEQDLQDKEVKRWWESPRNMRWDTFYDDSNPDCYHVKLRSGRAVGYLDELNLPKGAKVLELGYGAGQTAQKILERGYRYWGIDISEQFCEASIKRCHGYVDQGLAHFSVGSIEKEYEYEDQYFDAVIVCGALQYIGNLDYCYDEVKRVLVDQGHFVICQTNMYALKELIFPRRLILRIVYRLYNEEFEISPSFRSMLLETQGLGKRFEKDKDAKWMNSEFMVKGYDHHHFQIKKRLNSLWRLKKQLRDKNFVFKKGSGATFFFPRAGIFFWPVLLLDRILQKIADFKIIPYFYAFADNVLLVTRKQ